jgi:hypothetical protein
MNTPTIETAEQAEAALAELESMAEAIRATPGGKLATMAEARRFLDRADPEALKLWLKVRRPEYAVLLHIVGKVLRGEAEPNDLRVFGRKACILSGWDADVMHDAKPLRNATDAELGERLKALGAEIFEKASASVRHPAPGVTIEHGYAGDGY